MLHREVRAPWRLNHASTKVLAPLWAATLLVPSTPYACVVFNTGVPRDISHVRSASQASTVWIHAQFSYLRLVVCHPEKSLCSLLCLQGTRARCVRCIFLELRPCRHLNSCSSAATSPAVRHGRYRHKHDRASIHYAASRRCSACAQYGSRRRSYLSFVRPTGLEPKESKWRSSPRSTRYPTRYPAHAPFCRRHRHTSGTSKHHRPRRSVRDTSPVRRVAQTGVSTPLRDAPLPLWPRRVVRVLPRLIHLRAPPRIHAHHQASSLRTFGTRTGTS